MPLTALSRPQSALRNASTIDGLLVDEREQPVVRDHDQRIDRFAEAIDTLDRLARALLAFEAERLGHDAHRERAAVARDLRDDRSRAGAGAAAHAGGDEHHVRAADQIGDLLDPLFRRAAADLGVRARAEALGQRVAELDLVRRHVGLERLHVGVRHDELDAVEVAADHGVDRVAASAAHTDNQDLCVARVVEFDE